jgi:hypothetical protein
LKLFFFLKLILAYFSLIYFYMQLMYMYKTYLYSRNALCALNLISMFYWNCFFNLILTCFNLIHFFAAAVQHVFVNKGGTVVLECTCKGKFQWVRISPQGGYITIIENGKAKDDIGDHFRIPSMQCHDLEVSNITQTEGSYKCLWEQEIYMYKLNISGK